MTMYWASLSEGVIVACISVGPRTSMSHSKSSVSLLEAFSVLKVYLNISVLRFVFQPNVSTVYSVSGVSWPS